MPTYEYACTDCKRHTEVVQSFTDPPLTTCEHCGGTLKKVFHPVGIVLKGSGFYSTDNRPGKPPRPAKKDDKPSKAESKKDAKKDASTKKDAGSTGKS